MPSMRVIGPGRAGRALSQALADAGWEVLPPRGRGDDLADAGAEVDLLVVATPDRSIAEVAAAVTPDVGTVVAHMSGALGLDVLGRHPRCGSLHPLVALPSEGQAAARLRGAWWAVAGDPLVRDAVAALDGRTIEVPDPARARYHAAACIASNHLVALLGQVERVAAGIGVPMAAFLDLVRGTVDNVAELGPRAALTGPVARGDWDTVERHRAVLPPDELAAYDAMVALADRLAREQDAGS